MNVKQCELRESWHWQCYHCFIFFQVCLASSHFAILVSSSVTWVSLQKSATTEFQSTLLGGAAVLCWPFLPLGFAFSCIRVQLLSFGIDATQMSTATGSQTTKNEAVSFKSYKQESAWYSSAKSTFLYETELLRSRPSCTARIQWLRSMI